MNSQVFVGLDVSKHHLDVAVRPRAAILSPLTTTAASNNWLSAWRS